MTQPNFLQVERSLRTALTFVGEHPGLISSKAYEAQLTSTLDRFVSATKSTDDDYNAWRRLLGQQMLSFKTIRLVFAEVRELCDEHAYDDVPMRRVFYTEAEDVLGLLAEIVDYLEGKVGEWDWIAKKRERLIELRDEATGRQKEAERRYQAYTITVKARVDGYQKAVGLVREYVKDARGDAAGIAGFGEISFDIVKR